MATPGATKPFDYSPLADSDEIRLLALEPASRFRTIKCSTIHATLSDKPRYEALSYMWGPSQPMRLIELDGKLYGVRENLWHALVHLRSEEEERILWIDAVCINQQDIHERNHQVTQMGKIYSEATKTTVWLGMADHSTPLAVKFLRETSMAIQSVHAYCKLLRDLSFPAVSSSPVLSAVQALCLREYWNRLWIVQEVALATEVVVQVGVETFPWACLDHFFQKLGQILSLNSTGTTLSVLVQGGESMIHSVQSSTVARLVSDRNLLRSEWSKWRSAIQSGGDIEHPLLKICSDFGDAKCEERLDKIFGLREMASNCCKTATPVDYTLPISEVSGRIVLHHAFQHAHLGTGPMGDARLFYEKLRITSLDCCFDTAGNYQIQPELPFNIPQPLVPILAYLRGRLCYTSPPLHEKFSLSKEEIPDFALMPWTQLQYINTLRKKSPTKQLPITKQFDLILQFPAPSLPCPWKPAPLPPKRFKYTRNTTLVGEDPLRKDFEKLLQDAKNVATKECYKNCRLAIGTTGLVMFVPLNAREHDLVCQFPSTDAVMLVRESPLDKHACEIVGRAVNFLKTDFKEPCEVGGTISMRLAKEFDTLFKIDPPTLQIMSVASTMPDSESIDEERVVGDERELKKRPSWANALRRMSGFGGLKHTGSEKSKVHFP